MKAAAMKYNKVGKWLEERKRAKKVEHIGELKPGHGHKMDVLNRIKKSVSNVMPGNPLSRDFDIQSQVGSAGPGMLWRIYSAVKKSTKEPASVFLFEKKMVDRHSKRDKDLIFEALRKGVQQLTKLRHPKVLSVIHPLEENRETLVFATEPVFSSLANALGCHDNVQGSPKGLSDFTLYEVEIKHGLLQVLEALAFLHQDVKMLHRNLCPSSIILAKSGTWKLSGFEFSQMAEDPQVSNPMYSCAEWSSNAPRETNPHLDFMAPEYEIMKMCSTASDMFSFGVLLYSLYNKGKPLYECQGELSTFRRRAEDLSSIRGTISKSIPSELLENVKLLLNMEQAIRPDAVQMAKVPFFEDMACMALQYVDTLYQRDNMEKSNFFKGLPKITERLPKRVNQQRILPALFKEGVNPTMIPFVLPSVFFIAEQSTNEEYCALVMPDLIPYFKIKEPVQVMLMLLQNMSLLLSKTPTPQIQAYVLPLIFSALESDSPQIQELCLNIIPTFADLIEYTTLKSSLIPRIKKLCLGTSVLNVRVNALLCMGKLMDQMDKWYVLDEVLPFLREIPTREPAVLMSILGIHKIALSEAKLGITKDVMANKVLPFIIPLSIDNNLNLSQFNAYMSVVKEMMTKVETEHRTKLEQLDQIQSEHKTIEIGQIMPGGGDSGQTVKPSMMDQFMAGFGFGSSANQNNANNRLAASRSSDKLASKPAEDSSSKKSSLSIEEKQRLAKQQEQERELKTKQPLTAQKRAATTTSTSSSSSSSSANKSFSSNNASSGPKDLTKTLMDSNIMNMNSGGGSGSVGGLQPPPSNNKGMMGSSNSVNWGSTSSTKTNYSNYVTPMSSPASSDSSLYSATSSSSKSKSNIDMSSFDTLLPSSSLSSSSSSSSTTTMMMGGGGGGSVGGARQPMTIGSGGMVANTGGMGMMNRPQQQQQQQQQPSPMMMGMTPQQQQRPRYGHQQQQQQQPQQQYQPTMSSSGGMGGMGGMGMGMGSYGQGQQGVQQQQQQQAANNTMMMNPAGVGGGWGMTSSGGGGGMMMMGGGSGFQSMSSNQPMMRMGNPQNGAGTPSSSSKPLSKDDLKDFLG